MARCNTFDEAVALGNQWIHQHLEDDLEFELQPGLMYEEIRPLVDSQTSKIVGLEPQKNQMLDSIRVRPLYNDSLPGTVPNSQGMECGMCTPTTTQSTNTMNLSHLKIQNLTGMPDMEDEVYVPSGFLQHSKSREASIEGQTPARTVATSQ